jgi:hypothetical protein
VSPDPKLGITSSQLEALLERAAEAGAKRALAGVGLHDEDAAGDVRELRGLLEAYRDVKRSVWNAVLRAIGTGVLAVVGAAAAWHWWGAR